MELRIGHHLAMAKAMGRKDFARVIVLIRADQSAVGRDAGQLSLIAQCHLWLGQESEAIGAAGEALLTDANCFEAHRLLTSIYAGRCEHALATLHAQAAIRTFRPVPPIPKLLRAISELIVWLRRGRAGVQKERDRSARSADFHTRWLMWCKEYLAWSQERGTMIAANQEFRPPPKLAR